MDGPERCHPGELASAGRVLWDYRHSIANRLDRFGPRDSRQIPFPARSTVVTAARLSGRTEMEIIFIHMLPSFISYIIVSLTASIPGMILGETGLSFLGLGIKPPIVSWGVLLQEARDLNSLALRPWLLIPSLFLILTVLAFNFVGDGLREAADPYSSVN